MSDTYEQPERRQVDGYIKGSDPWQGMANPDAYSNWSPTAYEIEMPERAVWEADQGNRTAAADLNYGRDGAPTQTTPGPLDLPDRGYPRGPSAWDIAERERELLWRTEDRDRDRLWRSEDRALNERLRAEKEAKDKADRIKRGAAYDAYDASMRDVYNPARVNARFDPMVTATGGAYDSGIERLGGITRAMDARGVKSRKSVADAFTAGDQRLQGIRAQYAGEQVNRVGGFNDILSGYGAGSVDQGSGYMDRMFANAQIGNARAGTIFDASSADRGALVGGLRGDIETGMTQQKAALLAKIAADRIAAQTTSDTALATALAQSGIARGNL